MAGKTVLAIGPGLGQSPETVKFVTGLLAATKIPAVIDADALNILAAKPVLLAKLAKGRTLVLTPHPGEMARLTGKTVAEVQAKRLETARDVCRAAGCDSGVKRRADADCASRWAGRGEYDRESRRWRRAAAAIC